ncbi:MAG: hypothetical protein ACHQ6T_02430 [Myxococcota bacterium]
MSATRLLLARSLCAAVLVSALVVPGVTRSAPKGSTGTPVLAGTWMGKLTSVYWDQTADGFLSPKHKFKTNVTLTIVQISGDDVLAATISYNPGLPITANDLVTVGTLSGTVGNSHLNLSNQGALLTVALSGSVNKKANSITLTGVGASTDFTHQITIKLKLQNPT